MNLDNICIGIDAGLSLTTGHHNILIGKNAGKYLVDECYMFCLGEIIYYQLEDENEYQEVLKVLKEVLNKTLI